MDMAHLGLGFDFVGGRGIGSNELKERWYSTLLIWSIIRRGGLEREFIIKEETSTRRDQDK
jgi:hypothetical protein